MSNFRAFIIPFKEDGAYSDEEIEVTSDVDFQSFGSIKQAIDNDQYKVGVLTFNDLNLKLRNDHGKYSAPGTPESIFNIRRNESIFRLYWEIESEPPYCGLAICGSARLSETKLLYEGFINDDATRENIKTEFTSLKVISMESVITKVDTPFADFTVLDTIRDLIFKVLNQTRITSFLNVDLTNINIDTNLVPDDISDLESKTGKEALDELLLLGNAILYIKDRIVFVETRAASADLKYTFYGPASIIGLENIQTISDIRTGLSKTFNYWTWTEKNFNVQDASSVALYGPKKRNIDSKIITDTPKQQTVLSNLVSEFGFPKDNFRIKTPVTYETLELFLLDKINIDYPTIYIPSEGSEVPIYDVSKYDEAVYAKPLSALTIDINRRFKIMSANIEVKNELFEFELREI